MESQIKIKATVPEMSAFFEKDGGVRFYEIKDKCFVPFESVKGIVPIFDIFVTRPFSHLKSAAYHDFIFELHPRNVRIKSCAAFKRDETKQAIALYKLSEIK